MTECLLCGSANLELVDLKDRAYNNCKNCSFIFIDLKSRISIDEEIIRYNNHDICTNDDKSVSFVKNILDKGLTYIKGTDVLELT